ncbi:hypothetical protein BHE74_00047047 [Ensete ventricosum]|nr:hypothetical protein BHE74_00047047 [Ensete ventricosum]
MNITTKKAKENKINASRVIGWWRPCMGVVVYLFIDQEELLREHRGVEVGGQKGRGSDDKSRGAQLPKSKALVIKDVDLEGCHSAVEADLPVVKKGGHRCKVTDCRTMGLVAPWYHRGGTSVESSISCSHGGRALVMKEAEEVENAKANSKY